MSTQSDAIRELYWKQQLAVLHHTEMQKTIKDFLDQQSKVERINYFPYPVYSTRSSTPLFVGCFAAVLPFCMVREFDRLNEAVSVIFVGNMAWLTVSFSVLDLLTVRVPGSGGREHRESVRGWGRRRSDRPDLPGGRDRVEKRHCKRLISRLSCAPERIRSSCSTLTLPPASMKIGRLSAANTGKVSHENRSHRWQRPDRIEAGGEPSRPKA